jgi:predicted CXXCH cytochrome family protein
MDTSKRRSRKECFLSFLFLLIAMSSVFFGSCSRETRYKTLTFFFTGVPPLDGAAAPASKDINQPESSQGVTVAEKPAEELAPFKKHPPYAEGQCDACHDTASGNKLFTEPEKLCFRCHESFEDEYQWVHGPAAVGSCNQCHEPHQSRNEHLLISKSHDICFKCHKKEDILSRDYHQFDQETLCIDCHSPHGGADRTLLKAQKAETGSLGEKGSEDQSAPASQNNGEQLKPAKTEDAG